MSGHFNLSDIRDLNILSSDNDDEAPIAGTSGGVRMEVSNSGQVSAIASDSALTFLLNSTFEEEEEEEDEDEEVLQVETEKPKEECDAADAKKREMASKYLEGKLAFKDYFKHINSVNSEDEDGDEEDDVDDGEEEWMPAVKKKKKSSKKEQEKFESDLVQTQRQQLSKKKKKLGAKKRRLDPALQGLMGEANLRYARGDKETAVRMCMEVIRQDPTAPEPFQTLSTLYDGGEDQEKSLQFALIAAHLAPQDPDDWARLADMSLELGDLKQASICYKKAIEANVENLHFHWERCNLLEQLGDVKAALRGYKRLLTVIKGHQGFEYLKASKEIARLLHARDDIKAAEEAIYEAMDKFPEQTQHDDINLVLELLLQLGRYDDALDVLFRFCGIKFDSDKRQEVVAELEPEKQLEAFNKLHIPVDLVLDIQAKLAIVLIKLGAQHLVREIHVTLVAADPEQFGDLILDVAEAFMSTNHHGQSIELLEKLVHSETYGKAAVWLRFGESLFSVGKLEESEKAYQRVVQLAPQHHEARRTLSGILRKLGRPDEALDTLTQDENAELLNPTLLHDKCKLLLSENCQEEFLIKAKLLFNRHFIDIRSKEELEAIASAKKITSKNRALSAVRTLFNSPSSRYAAAEQEGPNFEANSELELSIADEYDLFKSMCEVLFKGKRFAELQRATFSALGSPYFNKKQEIVKEIEFLCLLSSFFNGDGYHAYNLARELVVKDVKNVRLWNMFNLVISKADDVRHNRFLMRLMGRNPDNASLSILNGHNCLVAGTYKYSLGEYMSAFKQDPHNSLVALMLGLTFTHMACQKFSSKKHSLVVQASAFLNQYLQLRGPCQESYFNLGRAMHQLGLLPAALHYYKMALECETKPREAFLDLRKETAFNLSLIYQSSGSNEAALMYLQKYIVM